MNPIILIDLFKKLLYVRLVEKRIVQLYPEQEMRCPVHLSIGQEAIAVGVCSNLKKEDMIFSNHRSHAHYLAKGGDLKKFFAELYGKITGCSGGRGGSMHLTDLSVNFIASTAIVGGTIPLAVGASLTSKLNNKNNICISFLGDASVEEGVFYESLNFAQLKNLPILFVCENNLYGVFTPINLRQPQNRKIINLAKMHGLITYSIDGNNILDIYETSKKAIQEIREGKGPIFIEMATYRIFEHCGPNCDDHLCYRPNEELEKWKSKDPVVFFKNKMINENILTEEEIHYIETNLENKINEAVKFAQESPFPEKDELNKFVYADE